MRILKASEVAKITSFSAGHIRLTRENKFPKPIQISENRSGCLRKMLINGYKTVFDPIQQSEKKTMKQINEYYFKEKFPYIKTLDEIISMEFPAQDWL